MNCRLTRMGLPSAELPVSASILRSSFRLMRPDPLDHRRRLQSHAQVFIGHLGIVALVPPANWESRLATLTPLMRGVAQVRRPRSTGRWCRSR